MRFTLEKQMCLLALLVLLFPLLCTSDSEDTFTSSDSEDTFTSSRATYYGSSDGYGTASGACGYGEFGSTVNVGNVAGVSSLYRDGAGCGACYQVRCTNKQYCSDDGVNIVVTDYGEGDRTDFILSQKAYSNMALPNMAKELIAYGVVDVEYRGIPCHYPGYNILYKLNEHSRYPHYLAIVIQFVAGQNDITAVELWREDLHEWTPMRRVFGTTWDFQNPPKGPINLRLQVSVGDGVTWMQNDNAIPDNWNAGDEYDSTIQLN